MIYLYKINKEWYFYGKEKSFCFIWFWKCRQYKYLLEVWDNNPEFDFSMNDKSSREINSWDVSRIKAGLTTKINEAKYTIVIVGKYANVKDKNSEELRLELKSA